MKNKLSLPIFLFVLMAITFSCNAFSEIYKHVGADGRVTYSNIKTKGATRLELDPDASTYSNNASKRSNEGTSNKRIATPEGFPKVDKETQNKRDNKRQSILQSELDAEKLALEEAKKAYAEGESNPEMIRNAKGQTFRNVAKFQEKMKNLQADVDSHENNIKLLQKELDTLH